MGRAGLSGASALVTGASRGIGRATAVALAAAGARVICVGRALDDLRETVDLITSEGGEAECHQADVTLDDDVARLCQEVGSVDVLVNNAGVYAPGRFMDHDLDAWQEVLDINVLGVVRMIRAFLPAMLERGSGVVVNIASTAGRAGSLNQSPYNASKHAVVGLTRCLALETAEAGVRVNAVCPGFVDTNLIDGALSTFAAIGGSTEAEVREQLRQRVPMKRFLDPEEVAALVVYLASDDARGMTGQAVTISGGLVLA